MSTSELFEKLELDRNNFYRNQFRRMVRLLILMLFVSIVLLITLFVLMWRTPAARYYASTTTGVVVPMNSLSAPVLTQQFILQWAETVSRSAYSLNFLTYKKSLADVRPYFTDDGYTSFLNAMQNSGLLDDVKARKLYLSTVVDGAPVVVDMYIDHGFYTWRVDLPLLVTFASANMTVKNQYYVHLTIKRVPELQIEQGIAVTNFKVNG
jgi:intracellular multiplication protein IcmL